MKYAIFDIDGTVADCSHRLHWIQGKKKDYLRFYADCILDKPIKDVIELVKDMHRAKYTIVFLTGRSDSSQVFTNAWLARHIEQVPFSLMMRREGDYRPDYIVKVEALKHAGITPHSVMGIWEDRARVTEALRNEGYRVYQVAKGDY